MQNRGGVRGFDKKGANDSTFLDSTMATDMDQTMVTASREGQGSRRDQVFDDLYTPRESDVGSQPIPKLTPSSNQTAAPVNFDEWAGEDDRLDLQPTDLGAFEKNKFEPRRTTLISKQFGEALKNLQRQTIQPKAKAESKKPVPKINAKEISNQVQSRFFGQKLPEAVAKERKISEAHTESEEGDSIQPTIQVFIEKFGFVEMSEVDQILNRQVEPVAENSSDVGAQEAPPTTIGAQTNQNKQFVEDVKDLPLLHQEIINGVNILLDGAGLKGTVCSFAISPVTHDVYMFGTETGELIECWQGDKPSVKKHNLDGKVTAIGISPNDEFFAAGSANSELLIKKTEGKLAKKYLKSLNQQRIQQILFLENTTLLVATYNCVYHFSISSMVGVLLDLHHIDVYKHTSDIVTQVTSAFHDGIWKGLVSLHDKVVPFGIAKEDKKTYRAYRIGQQIEHAEFVDAPLNNKWPPTVDWILPAENSSAPLRFVLIWRNYLRIYTLEAQACSMLDQGITLNKIAWLTVLDNRIVCLANTHLEFEFLSVERLENRTFIDDGNHAKAKIDVGLLKDQRDLNYMTKYKDKLEELEVDISMKLPFFSFFKNRIKDTTKGIYMITDKGLIRYSFAGLDKLVDAYKVRGQISEALQLAKAVLTGEVNSNAHERATIRMEAPGIVKSYVDKMIGKAEDTLAQTEILVKAIDTLKAAEEIDFIFTEIQTRFNKRLFWDQISEYVRAKKLSNIPYHHVNDGLPYLQNEEVAEICKDFFVNYQQSEVDEREINKVLNIMKKKNIWPFLYKFCVHFPSQAIPIFLTSLASEILVMDHEVRDEILQEAIWQKGKEPNLNTYFEEENRRLFFRMFWFFNLVLSPNALEQSISHFGDPAFLSPNISEIYAKTLEWILEAGNSKLILETHRQMYFEILYGCLSNESLLSSTKVIQLIKRLKKIYLKKKLESIDPTNLKFVAVFRPDQSLDTSPYPFCVAEVVILILECILDTKYHQELGFLAIKLLGNSQHLDRFDHIEWVYCSLLLCLSDVFDNSKFWMKYQRVSQDTFEDLVIGTLGHLNKFMDDPKHKDNEDKKEKKKVMIEAAYSSKL